MDTTATRTLPAHDEPRAGWPPGAVQPLPRTPGIPAGADREATRRVLRNTYALLAMTLLFSAAVAAATLALGVPAPGLVVGLVGSLGLLYLTHRLSRSGWGLLAVFAFTGFMGYTMGAPVARVLSFPGGGQVVAMALAGTALTFAALSAWALVSRRNFGFMGGFLFAGMVVALLAAVGAAVFGIPALALAVSAVVVLLAAGMMLFETSRIVNGGETNYVLATVGLYVSILNLFSGLLTLLGFGNSQDG